MTDERTREQEQFDEAIAEAKDNIMDAMTVLTDLQYYNDHEYVMVQMYLQRRLAEFAYDVEHRRDPKGLNPEEEAYEDVSADKITEHLESELQSAN